MEARLRGLGGVRTVLSSTVTGSIIIDYDPFTLAEPRLIAELGELSDRLDRGPSRARRPAPSSSAVTGPGAPLLRLIGSGTVLATAWLPVSGAVLAGLVVASDLPALLRAGSALRERRVDGDVLEASALVLLLARGNFVASALLTGLRSLGDLIVAKSVVTTRRSLYRLVAEPGQRWRAWSADGAGRSASRIFPGATSSRFRRAPTSRWTGRWSAARRWSTSRR